ncbi:MAG TPA: cyanophycin synthetase [Alphaproteobacteria bacterium]|nr:cyanophycin synthetase [Alphaproteobacteria bacterium]
MVVEEAKVVRTNARDTDAFDIFNIRHCVGPNPLLDAEALVFDFALTGEPKPQPVAALRAMMAARFPALAEGDCPDYATLFARTAVAVNTLDMGLHLQKWSVRQEGGLWRIAIQALHRNTGRDAIYLAWDWLEAMLQGEPFDFEAQFAALQHGFSRSVFGGPTTYALLRAAYLHGIPYFYLWDESMVQYGYGRKQVRGAATTFDRDGHLDSDFTTRKDDCKTFLDNLGFPVPRGDVVGTLEEAQQVAEEIGYPVVVKPVAGHKGIGVTAGVRTVDELAFAFGKAAEAIPEGEPADIIVENFITGFDFRLLCVDGEFVAATKREPANVTGDGTSTIAQLIEIENQSPLRADTPTSPLAKVIVDDQLANALAEKGLTLESVLPAGTKVFLRKVANLSLGGVSEDVTDVVHPDTIALCRAVSSYLRLTCLGIDVICDDISKSWKEGNFGIIEINAAPGIFMHLHPAKGRGIDAPSRIIESFFKKAEDGRIPIVTFNKLSKVELRRVLDTVLSANLLINPGGVCSGGAFFRRDELPLHADHTVNVRKLLRNPRLDLLICEYPDRIYAEDGMFYWASDMVVLDEPTEAELTLANYLMPGATVLIRQGNTVTIRQNGQSETRTLAIPDEFSSLYTAEIRAKFAVR